MKTKFLLNSFTEKFYINNEEDNVPIVPLVHVQVTKEICDSNISQIQNPQKEKVMIKSKSCVSNRITPKKVIDEYFNQRHMNTMKRINTLRDIKFEKYFVVKDLKRDALGRFINAILILSAMENYL